MSRVIEYRPTDLNSKGRNPISRSWSFNPGKDWRKTFKFVLETSYSCHVYKQFKWSLVRGLYKTGMQGKTSSMLHLILGIAYCTVHTNRENFPVALNDFLVRFIHFNLFYGAELSVFYWFPTIVLYDSCLKSWTWDVQGFSRIILWTSTRTLVRVYFLFNDVIIL